VCRSEWQTPQKRISIRTSCGPGSRRKNSNAASGAVAEYAAKPATFVIIYSHELLRDGSAYAVLIDLILGAGASKRKGERKRQRLA
jgi:hypothetical protein